jgi:hypothetical protein
VRVCLDVGGEVAGLLDNYCNSEIVANQLALKLKTKWRNLEDILQNLGLIATQLGVRLEKEVVEILSILRQYLMEAVEKASRLGMFSAQGELSKTQKGKLARSTEYLEKLLKRCEGWQFNISKRLVMILMVRAVQGWNGPLRRLNAPEHTTNRLERVVWAFNVDIITLNIDDYTIKTLPASSIQYLHNGNSSPRYLVESRRFNSEDTGRTDPAKAFQIFKDGVYDTARMLKGAEPGLMSILNCPGIRVDGHDEKRFQLLYSIPPGHAEPQSLRALLMNPLARNEDGVIHPLNQRIQFANKLATAVLYVHTGDFVHKHIKPENIVVFTTPGSKKFPHALGLPFLLGFDRSRKDTGVTRQEGDETLAVNVSQHPMRWGIRAPNRFSMLHDVYSLGVVLLEIGRWKPIVRRDPTSGKTEMWNELADLVDGAELKEGVMPKRLTERLIDCAEKFLPSKMGQTYADVVVACLSTTFEVGIDGVPDENREERVGLGYLRNIVSRLEKLQI